MKIGIIGAGNVGGTLGRIWAKKGHEIVFGVRNLQSQKVQDLMKFLSDNTKITNVKEAASFAGIIVIAVPWNAVKKTISEMGDISEKIIVDPTNPLSIDLTHLDVQPTTSAAEEIAKWSGGTVVKAFNAIGAQTLNNLQFGSYRADAYICGDDNKAKSSVKNLAIDIGFDVIDVGPLSNARLLEQLALLWIELAFRQKMGPNIAFKLLRSTGEM